MGGLPQERLAAVLTALDCEARHSDPGQRARLLAATRVVVEEWKRGRLTTHQLVVLIRAAAQQ